MMCIYAHTVCPVCTLYACTVCVSCATLNDVGGTEPRGEVQAECGVNRHCPLHGLITSHHKIVRGLEILEGLAENDDNVPFLLDLPVNTCQVIFNALLLGDLQVSE